MTEAMQVFHRGAVVSWARSLGISDEIALSFMRKTGAVIIADDEPVVQPVR
jgi:serine kinase of HPr protein (carbohydrate metabolism regulator)